MELDQRPRTSIAETMLGSGTELTLDAVLGALTVYYWWNDELQQPQEYIDYLITDIDPSRLPELMDVLHSNLAICSNTVSGQACEMTGQECFADYMELDTGVMPEVSHEELIENFLFWAEYVAELPEADHHGSGKTLREAYEAYLADRLSACGATDIEIGNALEVLEIEQDRRRLAHDRKRAEDYSAFRLAGGSYEEYVQTVLLDRYIQEDKFRDILSEYEDIDAATLTDVEKRSIVKRYIEEHDNYYRLLEVSFQKYTNGTLPTYLYRFSE